MLTTGEGDLLDDARAAYARRDWLAARDAFAAAAAARSPGALGPEDLYAQANAAWWLGAIDEALAVQQDAYRLFLAGGERRAAAMVALDVGYTLALRGEEAPASGWMSRAVRLLEGEDDCPERAMLTYLAFEEALGASDLEAAFDAALAVHQAGTRFGDPNLLALGVLGQGRVLVKQGQVAAGMALLDEAMVAAVSEDLDPGWAGNIYCHLMLACHELADLRRSMEWTGATARWCDTMPGAGPFMGICRVHRAQTLQVLGQWDEAEREAARVCEEMSSFHVAVVAEARYQLGEVARQRGDLAAAEAAFVEAHRLGRDPQPGLALLRLAQGRVEAAAAAVAGALAGDGGDRLARARLLPAAVEVRIAGGDLDGARAAAEELGGIAATYGTTGLRAHAHTARGAVLLAGGAAAEAAATLRDGLRAWQELRAPYESARVRALLARACEELGDHDGAALERDAARRELDRLGVAVALAEQAVTGAERRRGSPPDGLTGRQAEILAMVAEGRTNQEIAAELVLSVRTVERHLTTAYQKLDLHGPAARAAAVRYALVHGLGGR